MTKPLTKIEWATRAFYEYVSPPDGGASSLAVNKAAPDVATTNSGLLARTPLIRQHLNYILNAHYERIQWLEEKEIGELWETSNTALTAADVEALFGNTWEDLGTETKYGVSFKGFRRTT